MREFFRGWKRKVGCVTLLIAGVFMVGWMRSWLYDEYARFRSYGGAIQELHSCDHGIAWITIREGKEGLVPIENHQWEPEALFLMGRNEQFKSAIRSSKNSSDRLQIPYAKYARWYWSHGGFYVGCQSSGKIASGEFSIILIPYWSIVIPLTLLSAWLLLSKQRSKKQTPPAQQMHEH